MSGVKYNRIYLEIENKVMDSHAVSSGNVQHLKQGLQLAWKDSMKGKNWQVYILRESKLNNVKCLTQ